MPSLDFLNYYYEEFFRQEALRAGIKYLCELQKPTEVHGEGQDRRA